LILEFAIAQGTDSRLCHQRIADDIVDLRVAFQYFLHQRALDFLTRITPLGYHDLYRAILQSEPETGFDEVDPTRPLRPGEPGDLYRLASRLVSFGEVFTGYLAHRRPGYARLGGDPAVLDIVHRRQYRHGPGNPGNALIESPERHRADDQCIGAGGSALLDLLPLALEIGIAPGFHQGKCDTEPARFLDHTVVNIQPVSVFQMRVGDTQLPFTAGFGGGLIIDNPAFAGVVKRRRPGFQAPALSLRRARDRYLQGNTGHYQKP